MTNKEQYLIKKITEKDGMSAWLVDGEKIRKEIDENFVQFDQHAHIPFIPTDEIWIDKESNEDERKFFIDHVLREREFTNQGMTLQKAIAKASRLETHIRHSLPRARKILESHHSRTEALAKIHQEKWNEYSTDDFTVWLIDGEAVRDLYDNEYAEGGHDLVFPWIPHQEVWIEKILSPKERTFILVHELHERFLMSPAGGGKDYPHAHKGATIIEDRFRESENEEELKARIREELNNNLRG